MKNLIIEKIVKKITKNILSEGSLDKPILDISREVIRLFKNEESDEFTYVFYRSGEEIQLLVDVNFEVVENHNEPFEVYGEAGYDELYVLIIYDPQAFPSSMNDLVAEVKETITHELEHIVQQNFEDAYISPHDSDYDEDKRGGGFNYYVKKIEIPAFVKGLIKRSKTKRITLDQAMDQWYKENHRNFENENDWKDVKKIWMNWAKENLSKQKVKKFK
jgi:hypothetical protein